VGLCARSKEVAASNCINTAINEHTQVVFLGINLALLSRAKKKKKNDTCHAVQKKWPMMKNSTWYSESLFLSTLAHGKLLLLYLGWIKVVEKKELAKHSQPHSRQASENAPSAHATAYDLSRSEKPYPQSF